MSCTGLPAKSGIGGQLTLPAAVAELAARVHAAGNHELLVEYVPNDAEVDAMLEAVSVEIGQVPRVVPSDRWKMGIFGFADRKVGVVVAHRVANPNQEVMAFFLAQLTE